MTIEHNKRTAQAFIIACARHDRESVARMMTEDATYWVQGKPHLFPAAGEKSRAEILAYLATPSIFPNGLKFGFGEITAEDNRVAVESTSHGITAKGRTYDNTYHHLFIFRGEKIAKIKEYVDTAHAIEVFFNISEAGR